MLYNQTLQQLDELNLGGMTKAYREMEQDTHWQEQRFDERLAFLVNEEYERRMNNRVKNRLRNAHFKQTARLSDLDYASERQLNRDFVDRLATNQWIKNHENLVITGATGTGKSFLAQALGDHACRYDYKVCYYRLPELLSELKFGKDADIYNQVRQKLQRQDVLILDDWGLAMLDVPSGYEIAELVEDRLHKRSTIVVSQYPIAAWDRIFQDKTTADTVMDRLISLAYPIELKGPSLRDNAASQELRAYKQAMVE